MSSALLTGLLAFGFGAFCMLLGFFLIVRGIGASDSESTIKLIGIEIRTSRVGPGVLFSLFGLVLTIIAIQRLPSDTGPRPVNAPSAASAAPASSAAAASSAPSSAAPGVQPVSNSSAAASADANPDQGADAVQAVAARREQEASLVRQALTRMAGGACPPS